MCLRVPLVKASPKSVISQISSEGSPTYGEVPNSSAQWSNGPIMPLVMSDEHSK